MLIDIIHDWHQKHNFCNRISANCTIWTSITERTAANLELKDNGSSHGRHMKSEGCIRKPGTRRKAPDAQEKALPINRTQTRKLRTALHLCIKNLELPVLIRTGKVSAGSSLSTKVQDRRQERSKAQAALASSDQARRRQGKNPDLPKSSPERKEAVPTSRRFL